jgi:hypothetical protein
MGERGARDSSSSLFRAIAARLRSETTLPIKRIAARVQIVTAKGARSVLPHLAQSQDQRKAARALEPCAQLEFESTVSWCEQNRTRCASKRGIMVLWRSSGCFSPKGLHA